MAPVLQCPECGSKHPLDSVGERSAFPCTGCGRTLKVPERARALAPEMVSSGVPVSAPPAADPNVTSALPVTPPPAARTAPVAPVAAVAPVPTAPPGTTVPKPKPAASTTSPDLVPGRWVRFALWIVAVPLAFLIVFGLAKAFGLLTSNEVTDVALAESWHRFVPIARLVPFVALATAGLVQGGVYGIVWLRERRQPPAPTPNVNGIRPRSST